jgi:dTMP kinase
MVMAKKLTKGRFITFEGIDGCGKSTQLALAARFLKKQGIPVTTLREPGSTAVSEKIRRILLDKRLHLEDITELLLYEAARSEIVAKEIRPQLKAGKIVLCDRFYDSTTAYQGYGRRLDLATVTGLHNVAVGSLMPDLTFVFDVPLKIAMVRRGKNPDRLESQSRAFFTRVRRGFQEIAAKEPKRVVLLDARPSPQVVFVDVREHLMHLLKLS